MIWVEVDTLIAGGAMARQLILAHITAGATRLLTAASVAQAAGLGQQAVADALEIAQQTFAIYEVARARPAVSMLPALAQHQCR